MCSTLSCQFLRPLFAKLKFPDFVEMNLQQNILDIGNGHFKIFFYLIIRF